jgi:short subunit fatty acids transporter
VNDAKSAIHERCAGRGASIGAALASAGGVSVGFFIVVEDPNLSMQAIPDVIAWTVFAAVICAGLGILAGCLFASVIEARRRDTGPSTNYALVIPPEIEAMARERFAVSGEAGPQDGVKQRGEVRGDG